jgi:hypothetical protein
VQPLDAYAVLGVAPDAPQDALKTAHRSLVRRHHPDLAPEAEREAATRKVQDINVAYGLVRDPQRRAEYDRLRAAGRSPALEALVTAAGRWAGRWWLRHRVPLRRGAARVRLTVQRGAGAGRRAATETLGRVLWLLMCAAGTGLGWLLVSALQQLSGIRGYLAPLAATLGGLGVGHQRGWEVRLRLAGVRPPALAGRLALAGWVAAVGLGLWLDALLT